MLSSISPQEEWVLDSGASVHACYDSNIMETFVSGNYGVLQVADDKPLKIQGKGTVRIRTNNGNQWKLTNVCYVPGLRRNLISIGQLDDDGYRTEFSGRSWKVTKGAMVIARGWKHRTLYMTKGGSRIETIADHNSNAEGWHKTTGRRSVNWLKEMAPENNSQVQKTFMNATGVVTLEKLEKSKLCSASVGLRT